MMKTPAINSVVYDKNTMVDSLSYHSFIVVKYVEKKVGLQCITYAAKHDMATQLMILLCMEILEKNNRMQTEANITRGEL